jgi:putative transposase
MNASMMAPMKELEAENARLKEMYIEEKLKTEVVRSPPKRVVRPPHRREMTQRAVKYTKCTYLLVLRH